MSDVRRGGFSWLVICHVTRSARPVMRPKRRLRCLLWYRPGTEALATDPPVRIPSVLTVVFFELLSLLHVTFSVRCFCFQLNLISSHAFLEIIH